MLIAYVIFFNILLPIYTTREISFMFILLIQHMRLAAFQLILNTYSMFIFWNHFIFLHDYFNIRNFIY